MTMTIFMQRIALVLGSVFLLAATPAGPGQAHSLKHLEDKLLKREAYVEIVSRKAPEFDLIDVNGKPVKRSNFLGKVVVMNFAYASCTDVCPLHSAAIASVQKSISITPMKDIVQFITITTDPVRDTSDVMRNFGKIHELAPANWMFLTSGADKPMVTRELAWRYRLKFTDTKDNAQMHGVVTHIIDKSGNLRARYHGLKFGETNMILHINALSNDTH